MVVSAKPPAELAAEYEELAQRAARTAEFFHAAAEGGFGSGFLIVDGGHRFVVTNQHVVELATRVQVTFAGVAPLNDLHVSYVDPDYDLAIVAVPDDAPGNATGVELETTPASDQQPVVASGYPAIGADPSYQVTRGYVSNEHFELKRGGRAQVYIQHSAPIDPGSSGGPLTTEAGKLLGVNTLKARGRENVGLAIPASVVATAIARTEAARFRGDTPEGADVALASCEQLLNAISGGEDQLEAIERALGGELVAEGGWSALANAHEESKRLVQTFIDDPTRSLVSASALGLVARAHSNGKADPKTCVPVSGASAGPGPSFTVQLGGHAATWVFGWEQGRYKLLHDSSSAKLSAFQILERLGAVSPPKKKWKPSLR